MSFFRNLRSSISRGKTSSGGDTGTPVKASSVGSSSRPSSVVSNAASFATDRRRDSMGSHTDSLFNRSETFILASDNEQENEKDRERERERERAKAKEKELEDRKSKKSKSKVLSKFSTFTKRKKNPTTTPLSTILGTDGGSTFEHHPNDNATNTYYKWNCDGTSSTNLDYDAAHTTTDPFNFLYEQHSNLKTLKNGTKPDENPDGRMNSAGHFDSSTYRKGKASSKLKSQLEQLKTQQQTNISEYHDDLAEEVCPETETETETDSDANKYKTVTLNSFRKSFRDKFLQQQKDAALYNPSWFIEVEPPAKSAEEESRAEHDATMKENRREYLVFKNDNYRPGSRSPVRRDRSISDERHLRSSSSRRSPVKRNETFRVDQRNNTLEEIHGSGSIHVEFKNSVTPNGLNGRRMVPIGVAKPIQTNELFRTTSASASAASNAPTVSNARYKITTPTTTTTTTTTTTANQQQNRAGRYQTLVQISGDSQGTNAASNLSAAQPTTFVRQSRNRDRGRLMATHIQLGGPEDMPATQKYNNNNSSSNVALRHSYVGAPVQICRSTNPSVGLSSYELIRNSNTSIKPQRMKQTYFGGDLKPGTTGSVSKVATPGAAYQRLNTPLPPTRLTTNYHQIGSVSSNVASSGNKPRHWQPPQSMSPKRSASTVINAGTPTAGYMSRQPRHQAVSTQRRSRSPIKMPWR